MQHVVTCAMNPNGVMHASCDVFTLASWPSLSICDVLEISYWHAIHAC